MSYRSLFDPKNVLLSRHCSKVRRQIRQCFLFHLFLTREDLEIHSSHSVKFLHLLLTISSKPPARKARKYHQYKTHGDFPYPIGENKKTPPLQDERWFSLSHWWKQDDDRVTMKGQAIPRVKAHKHLGLKVTSTLSWNEHISRTQAKCAQRVGMIRKIRHLLPNHVLKRIYIAQFVPLWSTGVCGLERRQHFNSSEATGPFLPRKSCQASTSASKIQLPDFVAILQDKKQALAYVFATLTASSLQHVVTLSFARS